MCEVLAWAASGAMMLTGHPGRKPDASPAPAFGLLGRVCDLLGKITGVCPDPAALLTARAGPRGFRRAGRVSANGTTRLLRAADGWCAVTLSRPDDVAAVPAIIGSIHVPDDPWSALQSAARGMTATALADRAQLLAVPAAPLPQPGCRGTSVVVPPTDFPAGRALSGALVVDLSAMWAGPLCGHLLAKGGARVIKVESRTRPDGARADSRFFGRLHAGQRLVTIDFGSAAGRAELAGLLTTADIVIEASRPRALAQLGLAPDRLDRPDGQVWLSITGYGRGDPAKVAFGDDAAVAGGLVGRDEDGDPVFCADAIADPLTGVCGAYAAATAYANTTGSLIDLSMRDVAATFAAAMPECPGEHPVTRVGFGWQVACSRLRSSQWVLPPC